MNEERYIIIQKSDLHPEQVMALRHWLKAIDVEAVNEGHALVPIEPTDAMIRATVKVGDADLIGGNVSAERMSAWYKAMIEAAQESE